MRGAMTTLKVDGTRAVASLDKPPDLETLRAGIGGGWLEAVPGWKTFIPLLSGPVPCEAFCDEDGKRKQLPYNQSATWQWHAAMQRDGFNFMPDDLLGDVVVLTGDRKFMRSLRDDGE